MMSFEGTDVQGVEQIRQKLMVYYINFISLHCMRTNKGLTKVTIDHSKLSVILEHHVKWFVQLIKVQLNLSI